MEFYLEDSKTTTTDNHTYEIKKDYIQIAKPGQIRHSELPFRTAYIKFNADGEMVILCPLFANCLLYIRANADPYR